MRKSPTAKDKYIVYSIIRPLRLLSAVAAAATAVVTARPQSVIWKKYGWLSKKFG